MKTLIYQIIISLLSMSIIKTSIILFLYVFLIMFFLKKYKYAIFIVPFLVLSVFLFVFKKTELSKKYVVIKKTEFRLAPSLEAPVLAVKESKEALLLEHKIGSKDSKDFKKDWYLVSSDGDIGWVDEDFVVKV